MKFRSKIRRAEKGTATLRRESKKKRKGRTKARFDGRRRVRGGPRVIQYFWRNETCVTVAVFFTRLPLLPNRHPFSLFAISPAVNRAARPERITFVLRFVGNAYISDAQTNNARTNNSLRPETALDKSKRCAFSFFFFFLRGRDTRPRSNSYARVTVYTENE